MTPPASTLVTVGIGGIAALMIIVFLAAARRAAPARFAVVLAATLAWLALWGGLAVAGVLARVDLRPPPFAFMFVGIVGAGLGIGLSPLGRALARELPLWLLVGVQAFRLPLELVMHRAAGEGVMPAQLGFGGLNYDIVTGASALVVALLLRRGATPRLALAWNVMGCGFLAVIAGIAVATSPVVAAFGPDSVNWWVTELPFVYLPTVMVVLALAGHVVVFRRLSRSQ